MTAALGPYGRRVSLADLANTQRSASGNGALVLRRLAFDVEKRKENRDVVLTWATETGLGQSGSATLRRAAGERRERALGRIAAAPSSDGVGAPECMAVFVTILPEWRLVTGLGDEAGAYGIGISLHGTYGWPVIPASGVKGIVRHWATAEGVPALDIARILGDVDESERARAGRVGSVQFFDATPADREPVAVGTDVLTPHHGPYYARHATAEARASKAPPAPPAGWNNPVPSSFLTLGSTKGALLAGVVGPTDDVEAVVGWMTVAVDAVGIGAKTAAGYGYAAIGTRHSA